MNRHNIKGVASGFLWGADTTLISLVLSITLFVHNPVAPLVVAFVHDLYSGLFMILFLYKKNLLKPLWQRLKTRAGKTLILSGFLGGPVGMASYYMAVSKIGAGYTAAIAALYPAIGTLLAVIFFKDRPSKLAYLGIIISVVGAVFLSSVGVQTENIELLGIVLALFCAIAWGSESTLSAFGMKEDVVPNIALAIRQITSAVVYGIVIMPIVSGYALATEIMSLKYLLIIAAISILGTASYHFYYTIIQDLEPVRAMGLNITFAAWAAIFTVFITGKVDIVLIICVFAIIVRAIFISKSKKVK